MNHRLTKRIISMILCTQSMCNFHIHVIDSSGYRILDKAAVKSVRHIAALPEASPWLQGQSIDVILPVIYKLTDS